MILLLGFIGALLIYLIFLCEHIHQHLVDKEEGRQPPHKDDNDVNFWRPGI